MLETQKFSLVYHLLDLNVDQAPDWFSKTQVPIMLKMPHGYDRDMNFTYAQKNFEEQEDETLNKTIRKDVGWYIAWLKYISGYHSSGPWPVML